MSIYVYLFLSLPLERKRSVYQTLVFHVCHML